MTDDAYEDAKRLLDERFGDPFVIANAFRDKLDRWPKIASRDGTAMRKFADFLKQCTTAMGYMRCLDVLNDDCENRKLLGKLPDWLVNGWLVTSITGKQEMVAFRLTQSLHHLCLVNLISPAIPSLPYNHCVEVLMPARQEKIGKKSQALSSFYTDAKIMTLDNDTRSKCTLFQGNHPLDNC